MRPAWFISPAKPLSQGTNFRIDDLSFHAIFPEGKLFTKRAVM
jgi:hypothetical protein